MHTYIPAYFGDAAADDDVMGVPLNHPVGFQATVFCAHEGNSKVMISIGNS